MPPLPESGPPRPPDEAVPAPGEAPAAVPAVTEAGGAAPVGAATVGATNPAEPTEPTGPGARGTTRRGGRRPVPVRLALGLVAVLAGATLFLGGFTLGARVATTPGTPAAQEAAFAPFWDVYDSIQSRYAGGAKPSTNQLVEGAITGMLQSLGDPYSFYQSPSDFQNSVLSVGGQTEGIGVVVQLQPSASAPAGTTCPKIGGGCELAIVRPIPGSPAAAAGVAAGDVIAAVDGTSLDGQTVDQATTRIKGKAGTTVRLTLLRAGRPIDVSIVRQVFNEPEVTARTLADGRVEYLGVAGINPPASAQFADALRSALAAGRRSFIVDLRGNGGGYVPDARAMASQFIGSGPLLYQQDASGSETEIDAVPGGLATDPSIRVVVLVDGNTASAAEILAAALQARGRARLVGEHTYGKGVAQIWLPLSGGLGGFHLTVERWLTPNKVWIQRNVGLAPDVPATAQGARAGTDPVLDAGLAALGYPAAAPSASASATTAPAPTPSPTSPAPASPSTPPVPATASPT